MTAILGAIIGRVPGTDVLLDQLVGARFESSPTEVNITCRPGASPTQLPDGPLPVRALVNDATGQTTGEILVWMKSATSRRRSMPGTPTIRRWRGPRSRSWSSDDWRRIAFPRIDHIGKRRDRPAHA